MKAISTLVLLCLLIYIITSAGCTAYEKAAADRYWAQAAYQHAVNQGYLAHSQAIVAIMVGSIPFLIGFAILMVIILIVVVSFMAFIRNY